MTAIQRKPMTPERRKQIRDARARVFASASYWMEDFRQRLLLLIHNHPAHMTRSDLAANLEVDRAAVTSFLNSNSSYNIMTLLRMVSQLGYSPILTFMRTSELADAERHGLDVFSNPVLTPMNACMAFGMKGQKAFWAFTPMGEEDIRVWPATEGETNMMNAKNIATVVFHNPNQCAEPHAQEDPQSVFPKNHLTAILTDRQSWPPSRLLETT